MTIIRCQHPPSGGLEFANLSLVNGTQLRERSIHPPNAIVKPTLSAPGGGAPDHSTVTAATAAPR